MATHLKNLLFTDKKINFKKRIKKGFLNEK